MREFILSPRLTFFFFIFFFFFFLVKGTGFFVSQPRIFFLFVLELTQITANIFRKIHEIPLKDRSLFTWKVWVKDLQVSVKVYLFNSSGSWTWKLCYQGYVMEAWSSSWKRGEGVSECSGSEEMMVHFDPSHEVSGVIKFPLQCPAEGQLSAPLSISLSLTTSTPMTRGIQVLPIPTPCLPFICTSHVTAYFLFPYMP